MRKVKVIMKQIQFTFNDEKTLDAELRIIRQWDKNNLYSSLLIQIYTEILDKDMIERACAMIQEQLPNAIIVGCSSNGNILNAAILQL